MNTLRSALLSHFDQLCAEVHFAFMEVQQDARKGTIHGLRVSLKRLRAFLQMWDQIDPYFRGKNVINQLKPLFKEAGQLRDLQIESALLIQQEETLQIGHQTSDQVKIRIAEQKRSFDEFQQAFSLAGIREICLLTRSHIANMSLINLRRGIRRYFHDMLEEIATLSQKGLTSRKYLHKLRKRVKEAYYNIIAIETAIPQLALPDGLLQPLETLQSQLGAWHDHHITMTESKNLWNVPPSLQRQLREDEKQSLLEIRAVLAQLPDLTGRLLKEMDALLNHPPCSS
ncbi:MAG: CHAD domain-containing protein [Saprospiraceae bacterium]